MARINRRAIPQIPPGDMFDRQTGEMTRHWKEWFTIITDSVAHERHTTTTLNPGSVSANTTSEETVTWNGITTNDLITVNKPTHTTGLMVDAYVSAADTVKIVFANITGSPIDPGSEEYLLVATAL